MVSNLVSFINTDDKQKFILWWVSNTFDTCKAWLGDNIQYIVRNYSKIVFQYHIILPNKFM